MKADYLSGRTALHFAAINGHARCIRLVVADFVPSAPFEALHAHMVAEGDASNVKNKYEQRCAFPFHYVILKTVYQCSEFHVMFCICLIWLNY